MLPVVAVIKAKPGKEKALEALLNGVLAPTRKEAGCLVYELFRDKADPRTFVFIESWQSDQALQAHLASPHIQAAMARRDELIEALDIRALTPVP
jgi:quinol monooxygenase YgiN